MQNTFRKGNTLIPVVIIILAISAVVGMVAWTMWPNDQESTPSNATVHHSNKNTNAVVNVNKDINSNISIDVTADWKTYTNTKIHFSMKLSPEWNPVSEYDGRMLSLSGENDLSSFSQTEGSPTETSLLIQACALKPPYNCAQHTLREFKSFSGFTSVTDSDVQVSGFEVGRVPEGGLHYLRQSDEYYIYAYPSQSAEKKVQAMLSTFAFTK